jgi:glycosyltransferase involved in cell wall biosynthesis
VVNSASEACSLVILEAMASGTPVLATSTGGTPEIIEHQKNGWLITYGNDDELASGLLTMLGDGPTCAQLSAQGQRDVAARYSIRRFMTEMQGYYRAIVEGEISRQKNLPYYEVSLTPD